MFSFYNNYSFLSIDRYTDIYNLDNCFCSEETKLNFKLNFRA